MIISIWINNTIYAQGKSSTPLSPVSSAEDSYFLTRIGIYSDFNINIHRADFKASEINIASCCPEFNNDVGSGFSVGALFEFPIKHDILFSFRAGYSKIGAKFIKNESSIFYDYSSDNSINGTFEHSLDVKINEIAIEAMINYRVYSRLAILAGAHLNLYDFTKTYSHSEKLIDPSSGSFENGLRTRLINSGNLQNISSMNTSLILGVSYELPLNNYDNLFLSPETFYLYNLTPFISNINWKIDCLRFGLSIKYLLLL